MKSQTADQFTHRIHMLLMIGWVLIFVYIYAFFITSTIYLEAYRYQLSVFLPSLLCFVSCVITAVVFDGANYLKNAVYAASFFALFILLSMLLPGKLEIYLFYSACVMAGVVFAAFGYAFFIVLNNREKLFAMIAAVPLSVLCAVLTMYPVLASILKVVLPALLFLICLYLRISPIGFSSLNREVPTNPAFPILVLFGFILLLNDIAVPTVILNTANFTVFYTVLIFFAGILAGILLLWFLQLRNKMGLDFMINLSLSLSGLGFTFFLPVKENPQFSYIGIFFFGVSYFLSLTNGYYLVGLIAKKLNSRKYYRLSICFCALCYIIGFFLIPTGESSVLCVVCLAAILIFFAFSSMIQKRVYSKDWTDDIYRPDVTHVSRLEARLQECGLSPREALLCQYLLRGLTLKQSASEMGIAYPTANTYCTSLYKKLHINTRAELLILFEGYTREKHA